MYKTVCYFSFRVEFRKQWVQLIIEITEPSKTVVKRNEIIEDDWKIKTIFIVGKSNKSKENKTKQNEKMARIRIAKLSIILAMCA